MRQGPFYLGEDTFKEPKGKMIFYQCLSLFTFCMYSKKDDNCYLLHDPSALFMNNDFQGRHSWGGSGGSSPPKIMRKEA